VKFTNEEQCAVIEQDKYAQRKLTELTVLHRKGLISPERFGRLRANIVGNALARFRAKQVTLK
jgi:hypothetical protein